MHASIETMVSRIAVIALVVAAGGCLSPQQHRQDADKVAGAIVTEKQKQTSGETEPFTVERSADTLRRRLLVGQELIWSSPASLGTSALNPIDHWPKDDYLTTIAEPATQPTTMPRTQPGPLRLTLLDALHVAAANSNDYQSAKEAVFLTALDLDLERDEFRATFLGLIDANASADWGDDSLALGGVVSPTIGFAQRFKSGLTVTSRLALDLVQLLQPDRDSAFGIISDTTITMPLLRGAAKHIVTEPLTQAERNVIYAISEFEQFKREFAVEIAAQYLEVLQQLDEVQNNEDSYERLMLAAARSRRLSAAGRLPEIQVDQAVQQELSARDDWVQALQEHATTLDEFKVLLGLPPDAQIELDRDELNRLAQAAQRVLRGSSTPGPSTRPAAEDARVPADAPVTLPTTQDIQIIPPSMVGAGPYELPERLAIQLALDNRPDLRIAQGEVFDAQRRVVVAANALEAGLDVTANASFGDRRGLGSGGDVNARLRPERGTYNAGILLNLPFERTAERNAYRESFIALEQAVRWVQLLEDEIKLGVRTELRDLLSAREGVTTQATAVALAQRRVTSTDMLLQAGRAEIRDVLEAQTDLLDAQNEFTAALVEYRISELELQREMGVLRVDHNGVWTEYLTRQPSTRPAP